MTKYNILIVKVYNRIIHNQCVILLYYKYLSFTKYNCELRVLLYLYVIFNACYTIQS